MINSTLFLLHMEVLNKISKQAVMTWAFLQYFFLSLLKMTYLLLNNYNGTQPNSYSVSLSVKLVTFIFDPDRLFKMHL